MKKVISLQHKAVEKKYKEMFQNGSTAIDLRNENTYMKKTSQNNIDIDETRKDMIKGYMSMLSNYNENK